MRRYDESVAVRTSEGADAPESFVWRGRLYLVHAVVDHWVQRRPWWRTALEPQHRGASAAAQESMAQGSMAQGSVAQESVDGQGGSGSSVATALLADLEEDVWRVEAAAGRIGRVEGRPGYGVYDLVRTGPDQWRLLAVMD